MKIAFVFIVAMLCAGALSDYLIYRYSLNSQFAQFRDNLRIIAQTAALTIDAEMLAQIKLNKEAVNSSEYKKISGQINAIKNANPPIRRIYIMSRAVRPGRLCYIVDSEPVSREPGNNGLASYPGDEYNPSNFPEMMRAFNGPTADKKIGEDRWGKLVSGYAPIRDKKGTAAAILGVDLMAGDVYLAQEEIQGRATLVLLFGVIFSLFLGTLVSRSITKPIEELVKGTENIAKDNLQYRVKISGDDELSLLADSFNRMAESLHSSRVKLNNYFYNAIKSLIRILEAKDSYTCGHSERVAEYAVQIAARMGFPLEKIELLRDAAYLHDIGKLAVAENILNKTGRLTDEEWKKIREHPVIGEEILKPIQLTEEVLAIIRGHHERFDGSGYPDKLSGTGIHIFAAVVSVADAYDAMTSARAYRPAMSREAAMAELVKGSGQQFDPKVVDAFLQVLKEDESDRKGARFF